MGQEDSYSPQQNIYHSNQNYTQPPPQQQQQAPYDPYYAQPPPQQQQPYQPAYGQPQQQQQPYQPAYGQPAYGQPGYEQQQHGAQATYVTTSPYGQHPDDHDHHDVDDDKFRPVSGYRDPIFAFLFVAHLVGVLVILIFGAKNRNTVADDTNPNAGNTTSTASDSFHPSDHPNNFIPFEEVARVFTVVMIGVVAAFVFAFAYLSFMKKYARGLIVATIIASVVWCLVLAIVGFAMGSLITGVIMLIVALLNGVFYWFWRSRIPFAAALLTQIASLLNRYPAPSYYAYASLLVQIIWVCIWLPALAFTQSYNGTTANVLTVFLFLSYYWTFQVIKNVVHVTTSGLIATWYFMNDAMPTNPTNKAFKRAMTTSFGSICFGSLLVAILRTLKQLANSGRNGRNNIIQCLAVCILGILDRLLTYFNMYAFTQVAIYGKTYWQAAKDTWGLIKSHGIDAVVNDNIISGVLLLGAIVGGVLTAAVGAVISFFFLREYAVALAVVCFVIGFAFATCTMEVVESGVATLFVCFAMDPQTLRRKSPELYDRLTERYGSLMHNV
eukprot:TRINITY_DN1963_c0_g1_i1.p1 TRINITY_DN1963_c0_g1~~TRINITY_DN1963_c0_g1_i1.p1  ORF type:complete len:554 (-),score=174.30 TRINITY_DN1963_c0_g1_i1:53-1714(-)